MSLHGGGMSAAATPDLPAFDVCGPLPEGTVVLEASAGTGKTFTIAALTARYVAEGTADLTELLVVTFGRAATSELRDRVRDRLVATERALRSPRARDCDDAVVAHLADAEEAEVARRRARLARALTQLDAATLTTTHGFCQQMLTALGLAADRDPAAVLTPDAADLVEEVLEDVYLRHHADDGMALSPAAARELAQAVTRDPRARLVPADPTPGSPAGHRLLLAREVRAEVERRKRSRGVLDYDDLLVLLRDALSDPVHGPAAAARIRAGYRVVLVDEFQDTDPVQWEILRTAFHGHRTLVLIGDPKQAIYGFRGGDVVTYLAARADATAAATLATSWRADAPLLTGLETLFGGAALGDERIVVRPVEAHHRGRRLVGGAPVRLRQVTREPFRVSGTRNPRVGEVRDLIARDVAADLAGRLGADRIDDDGARRPLEPGDVAVLTRRNADAHAVREALADAGVPAVVSGVISVFGTPAAEQWLTLLRALDQPGDDGRAGALALTDLVGWDAARLAAAGEDERDALAERVRGWARVLAERGVAALMEAVTSAGLAERLLATTTGERMLTDIRHIGQALHAAATRERLGAAALTDWLRHRVEEAGQDQAEERSRRLETDAAAVQVVTVHAAKGLEFPVVYVPFAWDRFEARTPAILRLHDPEGGRLLHVGGPEEEGYDAARDRHQEEERGEDLRLLYVALTRAAQQVVVHWAPSANSRTGALSRLLLGEVRPGQVPPEAVRTLPDHAVAAALTVCAGRSGGTIAVEQVTAYPEAVRWTPPARDRAALAVAPWLREVDPAWRRTSYSALTASAHEEPVTEPEARPLDDEFHGDVPAAEVGDERSARAPGSDLPSPLADLPAGAAFGTVVHAVLESLDTGAPDLDAELLARCREAPPLPGLAPEALAAGLRPVLDTPLGPLAADRAFAAFAPEDRLAELDFELPLAGGDRLGSLVAPADRLAEQGSESPIAGGGQPGGGAVLADVVALLRRHLEPEDPFAGYADRLAALPDETPLRGYLTGSIDAVLRLQDASGETRYLVVDHKTNRLGPPEEPLTAWHYRPRAMAEAMIAAHYPLQLLLYSVALHRYLRWRQRGYDPERHLGGALYLFVRGMCGPATPLGPDGTPYGVLAWRPPAGLVTGLSALLEGTRP